MTYVANQALNAPPNRLAGESKPNTLRGVGQPTAVSPFRAPWRLVVAITGVLLVALTFVLLVVRA